MPYSMPKHLEVSFNHHAQQSSGIFQLVDVWRTIQANMYKEPYVDARLRQHYWVKRAMDLSYGLYELMLKGFV
jgi:hypothetical protein